MTDTLFTAEAALYWIAHGTDAVHFGELEAGAQLSTGQPSLETFAAAERAAWVARLGELGMTAPDLWPEPPEIETGPPVLPPP
jgi:hypothetical protein